jgi:hypothetical protein
MFHIRKSVEVLLLTSVTPGEKITGSLVICYISYRTINLSRFFPYPFPVLHVID